jgi:hypothetical protein
MWLYCSFFAPKPLYVVAEPSYLSFRTQYVIIIIHSTVLTKTHKAPDSYINVTVAFGHGDGMIPLVAEVKRSLGLPMYDAPNAVKTLKNPRKHPKVDALTHFEII